MGKPEKTQIEKFRDAAREAEADESEVVSTRSWRR
jgi:hypothetical protein